MMKVAEVFAELGFNFDKKNLDKFESGMKDAAKTLAKVAVGVGVLGVGIFAFTKKIAGTNDELGKLSERLGITTAELQSWQYSAELGGASAQSMSSGLENLGKKASEASRGMGAGVEVFGMLGISATDANGKIKESGLLMEEVADRVSQLSTQSEKLEFLEKLGISGDLLLTLNQGSEALRRQRIEAKELGFILDKNATKASADFNDNLLNTQKILGGVSSAISTGLMPHFNEMMTGFKHWFIANKQIIKQNVTGFIDGVVKGFRVVSNIVKRVVKVILALTDAVGGWKVALGIATVVMMKFNASAILMPLIWAGIATAVFLILEDLIAYFKGGESALGDLIDKFPLLGVVIDGIAFALKMVIKGFTEIYNNGFRAFDGLSDKFPILGTIIEGIAFALEMVVIGFTEIYNKCGGVLTSIGKMIDTYLVSPIQKAYDLMKGLFSSGGKMIDSALNFVGIGNAPQAQAIQSSTSNYQNSNTTSNNANISINVSGGNGKEIAANVRQEIQKVFTDMNTQATKTITNPIKS